MKPIAPFIVVLLLAAPASEAIVVRHDVDDAAYRARAADYPMVCTVGRAMGTLVAPGWILTAAHVAEGAVGGTVTCAGRTVAVGEVHMHPNYAGEDHRDIALLELADAFDGITPAPLYRRADELGKRIQFVGEGQTGNGRSGPAPGSAVRRVADNTVDGVRPGWVTFVFDAPPAGDGLEGISGPGDSGGPAILVVDGVPHVLGVSAYNEGAELCRYGTREHYARVSDELEWIDGVMDGTIRPDRGPRLMHYAQGADGQTRATRVAIETVELPADDGGRLRSIVQSLAAAMNDGSVAARDRVLTLFAPSYLTRRERSGDPVTGMLDFLRKATTARGPIARFHDLPRDGIKAPDSPFPMRVVIFHLEDGSPGYFGLAIDDEGKVDHLSLFLQGGICRDRDGCARGHVFENGVISASPEQPGGG